MLKVILAKIGISLFRYLPLEQILAMLLSFGESWNLNLDRQANSLTSYRRWFVGGFVGGWACFCTLFQIVSLTSSKTGGMHERRKNKGRNVCSGLRSW
jgi:hypothetical protein